MGGTRAVRVLSVFSNICLGNECLYRVPDSASRVQQCHSLRPESSELGVALAAGHCHCPCCFDFVCQTYDRTDCSIQAMYEAKTLYLMMKLNWRRCDRSKTPARSAA
jgi:hypothetical protein